MADSNDGDFEPFSESYWTHDDGWDGLGYAAMSGEPFDDDEASGVQSYHDDDVVMSSLPEGSGGGKGAFDGNETQELDDDATQSVGQSEQAEASADATNGQLTNRPDLMKFPGLPSPLLDEPKKTIGTHFDNLNVDAIRPPEFENEVTTCTETKSDSGFHIFTSGIEDEATPEKEVVTEVNQGPNAHPGPSESGKGGDTTEVDIFLNELFNMPGTSKNLLPYPTYTRHSPADDDTCSVDSQETIKVDENEVTDDLVEVLSDDNTASFDLDETTLHSGSGDSEIQILDEVQRPPQLSSSRSIEWPDFQIDSDLDFMDGSSDEDLGYFVRKKRNKRPSMRIPKAPRKSYDPSKARTEDFYGDVRRTITKLAETIETMPMPSDGHDDLELPPMRVAMYGHQIYALKWLRWREQEFPGGGILADEMGLGKTIMILALILKSKLERSEEADVQDPKDDPEEVGSRIRSRSTLVVCPLSCILQWEREVSSKAGDRNLSVAMFHGPQRERSAKFLTESDIVFTTYQTIAHEIPKDDKKKTFKGRSPLERIYWHRIVLDEGHQIRNPKTVSANAICKLAARHRWAVTGTPVHNRPEDFFSLAKFLRLAPFDDRKVWEKYIGMKRQGNLQERERLHTLGKALILRRTKEELQASGADNDAHKIPSKTVELIKVDLDEKETELYDHLMEYSRGMFITFLKNKAEREAELIAMGMTRGAKRCKTNTEVGYINLLALIVRLRQCAVLPHLIETMLKDEAENSDLDDTEVKDDIRLISKNNPILEESYVSSKIRRILDDLEELRERTKAANNGRMEKVVVVSAWVKLLRILHRHLTVRGFSMVYITGQDSVQERTDNMQIFNESPGDPQIVLLSLHAGAVGINLTGGNHVFFVEPHWNPQIELQAQDRVHRFGQKKDVHVRRYISNSTIEDGMLDLQKQKIDLAEGILANTKTRSGGLNIGQMRKIFNL